MSVAALIHEVIDTGEKTNMTKKGMILILDLIRKCLPKNHAVPNFRQAEISLLEACAVKTKVYAVCPDDCTMVRTPLGDLTPQHIKSVPNAEARAQLQTTANQLFKGQKQCGQQTNTPPYEPCKQSYADPKGRIRKVRLNKRVLRVWSGCCSLFR